MHGGGSGSVNGSSGSVNGSSGNLGLGSSKKNWEEGKVSIKVGEGKEEIVSSVSIVEEQNYGS